MTLAMAQVCLPLDLGPYRPKSDYTFKIFCHCRILFHTGRVWTILRSTPLALEIPIALPTKYQKYAIPLYISQTTSYLRVRLAFHSYPQIIPDYCNNHGFGPPKFFFRVVQPVHG